MIGLARSHLMESDWADKQTVIDELHRVQTILFHVGAELATPKDKEVAWKLKQEHIDEMEKTIDKWDQDLPELKNFILPSGHPAAASLHVCRTVVRRAERVAVS